MPNERSGAGEEIRTLDLLLGKVYPFRENALLEKPSALQLL
jgi:hypothetical protein